MKKDTHEHRLKLDCNKEVRTWWDSVMQSHTWDFLFGNEKILSYVWIYTKDHQIKWNKVYPEGIGFFYHKRYLYFSDIPRESPTGMERRERFLDTIHEWYVKKYAKSHNKSNL